MSRHERYNSRDLAYSTWHRTYPDSSEWRYIDIDVMEYCKRCHEPLALMELAWDVGQSFKATTMLRVLALRANIPAFLVFYRKNEAGQIIAFRVRQVAPKGTREVTMTPARYARWIDNMHTVHVCPEV